MSSEPQVLSPAAAPAAARRIEAGLLTLILLSLAHFFIDSYSSALAAFQPLLVDKLRLSLTQAGLLGGLLTFSSSVTQPAFGYLSDRFRSRMFSALAPAVAGLFISALGLAGNYGWALLLVVLGGAGISSFHPQGSSWATAGIAKDRARWMAVFISAGTLGMAFGPSVLTAFTGRFGFERVIWAAVPGILTTLLLVSALPAASVDRMGPRSQFDWAPLRAVWKPMLLLYLAVFVRSAVQVTYTQFLPLYLHRERGFSLPDAAHTLTLYLTCGAFGGFVGGHLADRFGSRRVILWSFAGSVPFLAAFCLLDGVLSILGLALGGLILLFTIPVNVVAAQQLVPSQAGTVSALMMGFAWGMAGMICIPVTGWISDLFSLRVALTALLICPAIGFLLTLKLPKHI
jgi:MFS transporter, FSR family, fosmidomycin resistance protein